MAKLTVEFLHPGKEADIHPNGAVSINNVHRYISSHYVFPITENQTLGVRFWNTYPKHKKKLLISEGKYISKLPFEKIDDLTFYDYNKMIENNSISFWGEWEPQSFFSLINSQLEASPKQIHFPFFIDYTPVKNGFFHSTDPYVFGKLFYYTHCLQGPRDDGEPKQTDRYLKSDDLTMILFGYEFPFSTKPDEFILDTLLVINKDCEIQNLSGYSKIFELANYRFTNDLHCKYTGIMYDNSQDIFSFVPTKVYNKSDLFNRNEAKLNWSKLGLQKPGARQGLTKIGDFSNLELIIFWKKIVSSIIGNGLSLGVEIIEPKHFTDYQEAWQFYNSTNNKCKI